ncbi:dihydrofolate synthase [Vibrio ishigakensis]|uniref:Dihydrofolate synthase n=1 Tax=Vibrio ishigakensis TaxID=1481914 RepID=A0A0B8Q1X4_9VIBR|nr:dihydrofolate synthase [Vibrio ishigakensis]
MQSIHSTAIDLGLDRITEVAKRANPSLTQPAPKVITVAGTNGKGSTCASWKPSCWMLAIKSAYTVLHT